MKKKKTKKKGICAAAAEERGVWCVPVKIRNSSLLSLCERIAGCQPRPGRLLLSQHFPKSQQVPSSSFFVIKREGGGGRKRSIPKLCCCCLLLSSAQLGAQLWMLYKCTALLQGLADASSHVLLCVCVCVLPGSLISIIIALLLSGKEMREGERKSLLTSSHHQGMKKQYI